MEIGRFLVVEPKRANSSGEPEVQLAELNGRIDQSGYKKGEAGSSIIFTRPKGSKVFLVHTRGAPVSLPVLGRKRGGEGALVGGGGVVAGSGWSGGPRLGRWSPLVPSLLLSDQEKDDGGLEGTECRWERERGEWEKEEWRVRGEDGREEKIFAKVAREGVRGGTSTARGIGQEVQSAFFQGQGVAPRTAAAPHCCSAPAQC